MRKQFYFRLILGLTFAYFLLVTGRELHYLADYLATFGLFLVLFVPYATIRFVKQLAIEPTPVVVQTPVTPPKPEPPKPPCKKAKAIAARELDEANELAVLIADEKTRSRFQAQAETRFRQTLAEILK